MIPISGRTIRPIRIIGASTNGTRSSTEDWRQPGAPALHYYPNGQEAAHLWYHDHSMGINRPNLYAGMFGHYLVRDAAEAKLQLPSGRFEVPLVRVDRFLDRDCQLCYPVSGDAKSPWVREEFGNLILVNGKILSITWM